MAKKNRVRKLKSLSGRVMGFTSRINSSEEEYESARESLDEVRHLIRQEFSRMLMHTDAKDQFHSFGRSSRRK